MIKLVRARPAVLTAVVPLPVDKVLEDLLTPELAVPRLADTVDLVLLLVVVVATAAAAFGVVMGVILALADDLGFSVCLAIWGRFAVDDGLGRLAVGLAELVLASISLNTSNSAGAAVHRRAHAIADEARLTRFRFTPFSLLDVCRATVPLSLASSSPPNMSSSESILYDFLPKLVTDRRGYLHRTADEADMVAGAGFAART